MSVQKPEETLRPAETTERRQVEAMMDEILDESFPASDPPCWSAPARKMSEKKAPDRSQALDTDRAAA
jgi:hypothetical protein